MRKLAEKRITAPTPIQPKRGNILAHDGRLLSSSLPLYEVYIDMRVAALGVKDKKTQKTYLLINKALLHGNFYVKVFHKKRRVGETLCKTSEV